MPSRSRSCQSGIWGLSSATSAAVTCGESLRQATHRSTDSVLIACTSLPGPIVLREGRVHPSRPPRSLMAIMLRAPDAFFGDLHPLDALEAEEQFNEVRRRLGVDPLDDCPERLLHVLAEGDALDRETAQVHLHTLVRLKHVRAFAGALRGRPAPRRIRHIRAGAHKLRSSGSPFSPQGLKRTDSTAPPPKSGSGPE